MTRLPAIALAACAALAARGADAAITVYPVHGHADDAILPPRGPGIVVMGGGADVDGAFVWMHDTITGDAAAEGGDVIVLRAADPAATADDDAYGEYLLHVARFRSVRTLVLTSPASAADVAVAIPHLDRAEAVFFAGGDQADYVGWRGDLLLAVQRAYDRGAVIGGTSAGADILGEFVNDAVGERHHGATRSADAIEDPFEPSITLSEGLLRFAPLRGAIVDTHFRARDRFGRLGAYMARIAGAPGGPPRVLGIGVDEGSALAVDRDGRATLLTSDPATGAAWVVRGGGPTRLAPGQPLGYASLAVTRLDARGASFDLARGCGGGASYPGSIDGARGTPYEPAVPYDGAGAAAPCAVLPVPDPEAGADAGGGGAASVDGATRASGCACSSHGGARGNLPFVEVALGLASLVLVRRASRRGVGGEPS